MSLRPSTRRVLTKNNFGTVSAYFFNEPDEQAVGLMETINELGGTLEQCYADYEAHHLVHFLNKLSRASGKACQSARVAGCHVFIYKNNRFMEYRIAE